MMRIYKVNYKEWYIREGCTWVNANSKTEAKQMVRDGEFSDTDGGNYEPDYTKPVTVQKAELWKAEGK
jgi:hypothetical protein